MLAHIGGLDGQLAMAAVDQHGQLHAARPAMVEERVQRGADGAAGVEHIVADHHVAALHIEADRSRRNHRANAGRGEIVAVKLDIEHARVHGPLFDAGDQLAQPFRQRNAAALDPHQGQILAAVALFHDLVGQAHQGALNLRGRHQPALHSQAGVGFRFAHDDCTRHFQDGCAPRDSFKARR